MKPINQRLHDSWFEGVTPRRLAILRILVGAFVLWFLTMEQSDFLEIAQATDAQLFAPVGVVFHGPIGVELFHWLMRGTMIAGLCFTLGLKFRFTGPLFAGLLLWLFCYRQSWGMIYHSHNLVVFHVLVLGLTRSADALSLDAFLKDMAGSEPADRPSWQYGWPIKLMNALTVSAYFLAAVAKLAGPLGLGWMSGQSLRSQVAVDGIRKELLGVDPNPANYALYDMLPLFTLLAVASMVLEFLAPLALLNRRIGWIWAINTFLMHWGIYFVMGITFEHHLSGVLFAPLFPVERMLDWTQRLRRPRPAAEAAARQSEPGLAAEAQVAFTDGGRANRT